MSQLSACSLNLIPPAGLKPTYIHSLTKVLNFKEMPTIYNRTFYIRHNYVPDNLSHHDIF